MWGTSEIMTLPASLRSDAAPHQTESVPHFTGIRKLLAGNLDPEPVRVAQRCRVWVAASPAPPTDCSLSCSDGSTRNTLPARVRLLSVGMLSPWLPSVAPGS